MNRIKYENNKSITWVQTVDYLIVGLFSLYLLFVLVGNYVLVIEDATLLPSIVYITMFIGVGVLGFITLPLHIYENLKEIESGSQILAWSITLTTITLFSAYFFNMKYASTHHSGFSDSDMVIGFLSALFLINSYFFVISLIIRQRANLFIHKLDYLFGMAMLLVAFFSTWGIVYLLCKVFCK